MRAPATWPEMVNLYTPSTSRQTLINASLASVSEDDMLLSTAEKKKKVYIAKSINIFMYDIYKWNFWKTLRSKIF